MTRRTLEGRSILLVEDEYYQAREAKTFLERAGAQVIGPTAHVEDVPALLASNAIDAAMLDINLGHGVNFDLARSLRDAQVPFLFVTGYDSSAIPEDLAQVPRIEKPADEAQVLQCVAALVAHCP